MPHTLLAFHGFTMNAECMRAALEPIAAALAPRVEVVCLNAPHVCAPASVDRLYRGSNAKRLPPPYLSWWDASDDGLKYRGWEETRDQVREALDRYAPAAILGFSQGAILAAAVAALAHARELPPIHCAVLIAGRKPRAALLQGAFLEPIAVPSLHVWGERDSLTGPHGQELAQQFSEAEREIVTWPGGHALPSEGPAYEAIVRFVTAHAAG
jgi:pimeloyl-ACP methyl ester carboxylesterase